MVHVADDSIMHMYIGLSACGNDAISVDGDATSAGTSVQVFDIAGESATI